MEVIVKITTTRIEQNLQAWKEHKKFWEKQLEKWLILDEVEKAIWKECGVEYNKELQSIKRNIENAEKLLNYWESQKYILNQK